MRIILRTFAILAAAAVVAGITFGLAQSSGAQSLGPDRPSFDSAAQSQSADGTINADTAGADRVRPGGFEHEGNRSPSLFGAGEIVKDLVIIGIIVALVAFVTRVVRGRQPASGAGRAGTAENI
ncbi:MAG TPA: hypothetical protein VFU22_32410 [Roseiflexaceae bacterium]|nr:hypothetical protein [Roseiflexaceae bacterium]